MHSAEDFFFHQSKLLSRGKLPFARKAGKACQVIDVALGPPDPVSRMDVPPTTRAASSIPSTQIEGWEVKILMLGEVFVNLR